MGTTSPPASSLLAGAAVLAACTTALPAAAQTEPSGAPTRNDFTVDLYQGPILAPTRVVALGGAYAGVAEGIAGFVANAASPAVRAAHSASWLELDLDASFSVPVPLFDNNDFDDSGDIDADYSAFVYLTAGAQLQAGDFGAGVSGDLQRYHLTTSGGEDTFVIVGRYHGLLGWQLLGDQLVVGAGVRALSLGISATDVELAMGGVGPQVGILVRPDWMPFRIGATYRHLVSGDASAGQGATTDAQGVERAGHLVLPERVELPWELEAGLAVQVGPRPLNPSWVNPHDHETELREQHAARARQRERRRRELLASVGAPATRAALSTALLQEEVDIAAREAAELERDLRRLEAERRARAANWPREHLLVTAELLVTGAVERGMHLERFLAQGQPSAGARCTAVASGAEVNFSPRLGVEMEPVPLWVHTRFGGYYEPNRFRYEGDGCTERVGRQHFTFGADVRLFSTTWFDLVSEVTYKLQGYGDLAPRYQAFGLGLGVWR